MKEKQAILAEVRRQMKRKGIDAIIVPSSDPHQSEYVAKHWETRSWVSGFTGSAGTVVITLKHAGLWTDSRYFIQAEEELKGGPFTFHKLKVPHTPEHLTWISQNLKKGSTIAVDGDLFSVHQMSNMQRFFKSKNIKIKTGIRMLYDTWRDRPSLPKNPIFELKLKYAGVSRKHKIAQICDFILAEKSEYCLVSTLDDIAWTLNLRGDDVESNPVFIGFLLVGLKKSYLFVDSSKISSTIAKKLRADHVHIKEYKEISAFLKKISIKSKIMYDPAYTSISLSKSISKSNTIHAATPSTHLKAIKNETEIAGIRQAMIKDGVALTKLYMWLEANVEKQKIDEVEVADTLAGFRKEQTEYHGESFGAIVGYQGNGAIVHYSAKRPSCATLKPKGVLLLDSGGQYHCGTTDITRTITFSKPSKALKQDYTAVLKGHIALAACIYPKGTRGNQLDLLARKALWANHKNYGHGTGHGVGHFLNVHEGPQSISPAATGKAAVPLVPGMLTSNEPGFYKSGAYGIRIENLVLTVEVANNEFDTFYGFETLTLFPIDTQMIAFDQLTKEEVTWLNNYHKKVYKTVSPALNTKEKKWLKEKCKAI
jgi:Xaa-Pro aminopeptidase